MRKFNINFNDRKVLYGILSIVLVCIFTLTIAYAALFAVLTISGNAEVVASTWDIHLDNIKVMDGSVSENTPTITSGTTATFSVTLNMPGDFYEFTIDVVNNGSIDAMIDGVSKTSIYNESKYLNYIVEYQNGESINTKQLVSKNSFVRLKVRVEYRKDLNASDLPTSAVTKTLSFTVNYSQSDGTGSSVSDNGVDLYAVGTEKCFGSECFYIISSDEDTVTMLAKYNLYVSGSYNDSTKKWAAYGDEATGKQDSNMIGWISGGTLYLGTEKFSSTNYWSSTVSNYPAYVYNENAVSYNYVENYKNYLSTLGVTIREARLITNEELELLGCSSLNNDCLSAPSWVYATSYWTGTVSSAFEVGRVFTDGRFKYLDYSYDAGGGCRPVIVVDKSLL